MRRFFRNMFFVVMLVCVCTGLSACGEEEKQFDFGSVSSLRIYTTNQQQMKQILGKKRARRLVDQISNIVWVENEEEDSSEFDDWLYRVQCYDKKGEKKQNIYICSETRILYKNEFWDAKDKDGLDLSEYVQLLEAKEEATTEN